MNKENNIIIYNTADAKEYKVRPDYFDELLERIRDVRVSEKRFYQKIRDLFALSSDYDPTEKGPQMICAETQTQLLFAVTGKTAAEIIVSRANAEKPNMTLTSWKGSIVHKQDVFIAKNYLTEDEIDTLNRLVVIFLESAELPAKNRMDITLKFWHDNVDKILEFQDKNILRNAGSMTNKEKEALQADNDDLEELKQLEEKIKKKKSNFQSKLTPIQPTTTKRAMISLKKSSKTGLTSFDRYFITPAPPAYPSKP